MGSLGLRKPTTYPSVLINDNIIGQGNISRTDHGSIDIMDITTTKCTDVLLTAYINYTNDPLDCPGLVFFLTVSKDYTFKYLINKSLFQAFLI
jgi:hypothetical protein